MKRASTNICLAAFLSAVFLAGAALAQGAPPAKFDLADVHASKPTETEFNFFVNGGSVELRGATMLDLIEVAYHVHDNEVIGGPGWLNTDRFDIAAKAQPATPEDQIQSMLQALLVDRFKLAIHREERPLPAFVLTVGNLKLKKSLGKGASECNTNGGQEMITATCQNMPMDQFVGRLRNMAAGYFNGPLIDRTGLKDAYDFTLSWTGRGLLTKNSGVSLFDAIDKQLGLKIEAQPQPTPVIVIDSVNQKPTDNPPGTTRVLPPPPTEFEVASVRVSKLTQPGAERVLQSGRVDLQGLTLKDLITAAYDIDDERLVGVPKWMETDRFDVAAKTQPGVPFDALIVMLQKLLAERFKLAVHREDQPVPVFALTPGKRAAKLKESSGRERSECKLSVSDAGRTYTCTNTTMAQFVTRVRQVAGGYLGAHPVVDLTGLTGSYDFALTWAPVGRFNSARGGDAAPSTGGAAADPTGDLTVFEAVDKHLGLKLAEQKHPMSVVVIDHVDRTPAEN
jgi:uncharacterized protein (TIGR03435 family)